MKANLSAVVMGQSIFSGGDDVVFLGRGNDYVRVGGGFRNSMVAMAKTHQLL